MTTENKTGWNVVETNNGSDFLRVKDGETKTLRLYSRPLQFKSHATKDSAGKFTSVVCLGSTCPVCRLPAPDGRARNMFITYCVDRSTGRAHLFQFGTEVNNQVAKFAQEWGSPREWDVKITASATAKPYYSCVNLKPATLKVEEIAAVETLMEKTALTKFVTPPSVDEVCDRLGINMPVGRTVSNDFVSSLDDAPSINPGPTRKSALNQSRTNIVVK